ncbi:MULTISPECIES: TetR/AcrR family transcriptional regulator [Streptomyces]|uniref:TetR/AcrR family transcriptional regulator n=1 Tax=Streptomyces TaxID=1883 RepID=UPI0029AFC9D4|nr:MULTISPECIES: TetR/AcrR family transcriptional regulator C-terminal domain-containing protein [Streptomyces]MDX3349389.1 TetR/AcrR family transcriptional regulator C-terminal domain-containing protein [Streptomyces sp. ME02-6979A]
MNEGGARRLRSRAAKEPLSLEAFTSAAIGLLEREGMGAVTLRRLARELQTGSASLYAYVRTVQELHALLLDRMLAAVDLHPHLADRPRERLEAVCSSYLRVLRRSEGLAQLAAGVLPYGDNAITLTDTVLGCLRDMGLSPARAAWGYDVLMLHLTAIAAEQDRRRTQKDPVGRAREAYDRAAADRYPHVAALRAELFSGTEATRVTWAVEVVLAGIASAREPES